eukprot:7374895-Prymnesium_polylepis.1
MLEVNQTITEIKIGTRYDMHTLSLKELRGEIATREIDLYSSTQERIDWAGAAIVAGLIRSNTHLKSLTLNSRKPFAIQELRGNTPVEVIDLSSNDVTAPIAWIVSSLIKANMVTKTLKLADNDFGDRRHNLSAGHFIGEALEANKTLTALTLSGNTLQHGNEEAADWLAGMLKRNTTLTSLEMANCSMGAKSAEFIAEGQCIRRQGSRIPR